MAVERAIGPIGKGIARWNELRDNGRVIEMSRKTKIGLSLGALALAGLAAFLYWYLEPYSVWWQIPRSRHEVMSLVPRTVQALPPTPAGWERVELGGLALRLPVLNLRSVTVAPDASAAVLKFDSFTLSVMGPSPVPGCFSEQLAVIGAHPNEVSYTRREASQEAMTRLVVKSMQDYATGYLVLTQPVKAIIILAADKKFALAELYSANDRNHLTLTFVLPGELDEQMILHVLAGAELTDVAWDKTQWASALRSLQPRK